MGRAQRARAARRERALAAARALVIENGVAALSMRKLAARADLAVNTVYSVLGASRDAILEALVDDGIGRLLERLEASPDAAPLEAARQLIELAVAGMVPRGPLGNRVLKKLKVYPGPEHPHTAQKPEPIELVA